MNRYNAIYIQMKQFSFATIYWGCFGNNMNIFVIAYLLFEWKWICAEFFLSPFWVEVDLCRFHHLLISVAILEIQLSRARTWIYNVICCDIFVFNDLRWEVVICFVDISRIIAASLFKLSWPLHILVILLRPFGSFVPKDVTLI
jgi:hypothetical protein